MGSSDSKYIVNLIAASKKGNKNYFLQLVELYLGNIYLLNLRLQKDQKLAEEITKEIFIHTWQNIKQIRSDTTFSSWLHGIAIYKNLDLIRKKQASENTQTSEAVKYNYSNKKLENQISELDDNQRFAFILHDIEKYSFSEIADLLAQYPEETIIEFVYSARKKLAKGLEYDL